ncbi:MAG: ImmA/IrrE family metallo-endopeptidase [Lachnospiraceae bacterium]|nr:ImmA/IrrE family metallo-endopeptidase [Lachnospiraceae bacterium]
MIGRNDQVVLEIQKFIISKKKEKNIVNEVIRDDVFAVLEGECIVLYYALEDYNVEGCHIIKPFNGRMEQFVFINTMKAVQEQTWTAAHELGHVWRVDSHIKERIGQHNMDSEDLVNRFAAELLLPQGIFKKELSNKLKEYDYRGPSMSAEMMVRLVTYLMNYFCTPYKAIIRRFIELGYIEENAEQHFLKGFEEQRELYKRLIVENQYTRLETVNKACSMAGIEQDINLLEQKGVYSDKKISRLRKMFHLERTKESEKSYDFGG